MRNTEQWVKQQQMKQAVYQWLLEWRWQWFCSMNLPPKKNHGDAEGYLKEWRKLLYKEGIEICYMGLYVEAPHHHVHLLMIGYDKEGHSLFYAEEEKWEREWARLTKQKAVIKWINDTDVVTEYVAFKNTVPGKYELLDAHNKKMLARYKRK